MTKPRVFIGSSVEGLNVAYAVQQNLLHDAEVTVWDQGIFELSKTTIESLTKALHDSDFAVFVFSPDDLIKIRSTNALTVRDNVIFEFGLFIGRLGRERVYFLLPMGGELHVPTDLLGITPGRYEIERTDGSMQAATGAACHQVRSQMRVLGLLSGRQTGGVSSEESASPTVKRSWIQDYFEKKFADAKRTLIADMSAQSVDDAISTRAWIILCDYHLNGNDDVSTLAGFAEEHADKPRIQVLVANLLRLEGMSNRAMSILTTAKVRFPGDASIRQAIARCHSDVEDSASAIAELQHFGPEQFPDVAIDLAEAFESETKIDEALKVVQRCYANHPAHIRLRFKYARLAQEIGKHEIALALLSSLKVENPESIDYWGYLGNTCLALDLHDQALIAYRRAEALMTEGQGSQWITSNIGNLMNYIGLPAEACKHLERSLKYEPLSEYAHDRMASSLKKKAAEEKLYEKARADGRRQIREEEISLLTSNFPKSTVANALPIPMPTSPKEA